MDENYENVILHVVWKNDKPISLTNGEMIPTLELCNRVNVQLISRYTQFIGKSTELPCLNQAIKMPPIYKADMLNRTMAERMKSKSDFVLETVKKNWGDWNKTAIEISAKSFGGHLNQQQFFKLVKSIPKNILHRHQSNHFQLEALIFGQSGFLGNGTDQYQISLRDEYQFLCKKYGLEPTLKRHEWNFHRLRPASFPTIRLSQFVNFIEKKPKPI